MTFLNFRRHPMGCKERSVGQGPSRRVTVDGVEIKLAWLIRTGKRGVVKTYDVFGDGRIYQYRERNSWPAGIKFTESGIAWKAHRGRVKISCAEPIVLVDRHYMMTEIAEIFRVPRHLLREGRGI